MEQGLQGRRRREGDNFFCNAIIFLILMLMMLLFQLPRNPAFQLICSSVESYHFCFSPKL